MSKPGAIQILCSTDNNYAPYAGIMLTSLFVNNRDEAFEVHVLTRGLNSENSEKLRSVGKQFKSVVNILTVDLSVFEDCPIRPGDHVTLETYFRLLAPQLLPEHLDRILYLDVDMVINGPIRELWEWNIDGYALGAILDESYCNPEIYSRLGLNSSNPYFNAGVLLVNLKYWREMNVSARCMQCINDNPSILLFHDQDTLNRVLQNEKVLLPITYNFQTGYYLSWVYPDYPNDFQAQIQIVAKTPIVIHFSGPMKPWVVGSDHPYRFYYHYYRKISLWKDFPLVRNVTCFEQIRLAFGRWAKSLGLTRWKFAVKTIRHIKKPC